MYDNSNPDFRAGKEGWTHHVVSDQAAFDAGQAERNGKPFSFGSIGAVAGSPMGIIGILVGLPFVLFGFAFLLPIFPIAGVVTLLGGLLIGDMVGGPGVSVYAILLAALLPCLLLYAYMMTWEQRAAGLPPYRKVRHVIRVLGYAFVGNEFLNPWITGRRISPNEHFWQSFSLLRLLIIVAAAVGAHYGSRWLDRRLAGRMP
jgi:hypothetical protein